jgi:branched-chain amino acid transport system substrate-binding protein
MGEYNIERARSLRSVVPTSANVARAVAVCALLLGGLLVVPGCSLTNIGVDDCTADSECSDGFGFGSECSDGYCTPATTCTTGHDCRRAFGGGACLAGVCVDELPADPSGGCTVFEPDGFQGGKIIGPNAPLIVGGMFLFEVDFSPPIIDSAKLAVREINDIGGGLELGRKLAMVICDNGGPMNSLEGANRQARIEGVVDYLAGTLGVPFIVGPLTSGDSIATVQYLLNRNYPTVLVSPSATSPGLTNEPDKLDPTDPYGLFWRTAPSDALQGKVLAQNVAGIYPTLDPLLNSVVAPYRDDAYGLGLANAFQVEFAGTTTLQKFDIDSPLAPAAASAAGTGANAVLFIDIGGVRATDFIAAMAAEPGLATRPLLLADGSKTDSLLDVTLPVSSQQIIFNNAVGTVAAPPAGPAFNLFAGNYQSEFGNDPANSAFTANGYDAVYVGAAALVYAAAGGNVNFDGRHVAEGMSKLVGGAPIANTGSLAWAEIKQGLTTGARQIDITGVSGPLDFDVDTGQAEAAIEIWKPSSDQVACQAQGNNAPCILRLDIIPP